MRPAVSDILDSSREMHTFTIAWKCPACQSSISHEADGLRQGVVYRCHVCRLELIADGADRLVLAPLSSEETDGPSGPHSRPKMI
jgi:hypothetical protein